MGMDSRGRACEDGSPEPCPHLCRAIQEDHAAAMPESAAAVEIRRDVLVNHRGGKSDKPYTYRIFARFGYPVVCVFLEGCLKRGCSNIEKCGKLVIYSHDIGIHAYDGPSGNASLRLLMCHFLWHCALGSHYSDPCHLRRAYSMET
jgi:hypothetical protein